MWKSRLFWKFFVAQAVLIVLAVGACAAIVAGWQEEQLVEQVQRRLHDSATLLKDHLRDELLDGDQSALQQRVRRLGENTDTRFTLVDAKGKVVADSEQTTLAEVDAMDDHSRRQEFVRASHEGEGVSRRLSPTVQSPFLYFATAIDQDGETVGFVRAAEPIAAILEKANSIQRLIWLVGLAAGMIALALAYWLTRRMVQPIEALTAAAEEMATGRYPERLAITSDDELGTLTRTFGQMVDKLATRERELRENVQRQATVLAGMVEGVIAVDAQERILFANNAAGKLLGFVPQEIENRSLLEAVRDHRLRQAVQQVLDSQEPYRTHLQWMGAKPKELEVHATPLPGEPCPGVVIVLDDVTELRRLEGLRQQFVANVSHELKTPLSSIKAYAETLLGGAKDDPEHSVRFLGRIDEQADRLHQLIQDMLSIARIEAGQAALDNKDIPLAGVTRACLTDFQSQADAKQVRLVDEVADSSTVVKGDEQALRQILDNLVDNALKYTAEGGQITVRCHREGSQAILEVADTGIGIDRKHHARLFERFYRVDKARSRELGGTGLGLSIVKHLAQAMGGGVEVESAVGTGSRFRIKLPAADRES